MLIKRKPQKPRAAHLNVARATLDGQSFASAMKENGFSPTYAAQGPAHARKFSGAFDAAFYQAAMEREWSPEQLKGVAIHRLATNVVNGKDLSPRSVEMIGRLKNVDLFVRSGDIQVGVFQQFAGDPGAVDELRLLAQESGLAASAPESKAESATGIDMPAHVADLAGKNR